MIENPFEIPDEVFYCGKLYVPIGTKKIYLTTKGWDMFIMNIEEGDWGYAECEKPTISYKDGKLSFNCETENAECHSTITNEDIKSFDGNEVNLTVTYNISVYATKSGYVNSEKATATLCWIEVNPQVEGITTDVNQIAAIPVMIKAEDGIVSIEGGKDGMNVIVYTIDGVQEGSAIIRNGVAMVNTNIPRDSVAIVKIGNKSVKVIMK